jgi:uncharacterized protein
MSLRFAAATALVVVLTLPNTAIAQGFKVPPTPGHYVTDNAGALSESTRASLENTLQAYERATGHQVIVWIDQTTGDVPLETWTGEAAHTWKIGRRGKDDGAVLFLFMRDRKVRIEVGYGLESSLTDADSHRIIADDIVPKMKAGDRDGAVSTGVAAMLTTITPSYKGVTPPPAAPTASDSTSTGIAVFLFSIVGLFFLILILFIVMQVVSAIRYGYLVLREGSVKAKKDMKSWPAWATAGAIGASSWSSGGGGDFGGGFSGGGGDFGGGGASGGW